MKYMKFYVKSKHLTLILLISVSIITSGALQRKPPVDNRRNQIGYIPIDGFVPDEATALKIAEAVWLPIYGKKIYNKKPFKARLENGVWYIEGSLPSSAQGGVPYIEIQKKDGNILKVMHGK